MPHLPVHPSWKISTFNNFQKLFLVKLSIFNIILLLAFPTPCEQGGGWELPSPPPEEGGEGPIRTAAAVSLLSAKALSRSLRVSSLLLLFFPLGKGSLNFLCFLFDPQGPISQRGHST